MVECSRHINLVKVPAENSDILLSRVIQEASYQRRILLRRLVEILEADHLARLAFANVSLSTMWYCSSAHSLIVCEIPVYSCTYVAMT